MRDFTLLLTSHRRGVEAQRPVDTKLNQRVSLDAGETRSLAGMRSRTRLFPLGSSDNCVGRRDWLNHAMSRCSPPPSRGRLGGGWVGRIAHPPPPWPFYEGRFVKLHGVVVRSSCSFASIRCHVLGGGCVGCVGPLARSTFYPCRHIGRTPYAACAMWRVANPLHQSAPSLETVSHAHPARVRASGPPHTQRSHRRCTAVSPIDSARLHPARLA